MRGAAVVLGFGALAAWAIGCDRHHGPALECTRNDQCPGRGVCAAGTCVPRDVPPDEWAVQVAPLSSAASGLLELEKGPIPADIMVPDKVMVTGTLAAEPGAPRLTAAHVILSVPPVIPGRPDLQLETNVVAPKDPSLPSTFSLSLPAGAMGHTGTLRVLPFDADALAQPPATLAVLITPALNLVFPSKIFLVQGRLRSAARTPKVGHMARAFQGGELVSTVDVTAEDGSFAIAVSAARVGPAPAQAITLELAPPEGAAEPRFVSKPFSVATNVDLGDVLLPAFGQANIFRFAIHGDSESGPPVPGVVVQARTLLADDTAGTTTFLREAVSNSKGEADLALLPGVTGMVREYEVAIVPPTGSPFAIKCLPKLPLSAGGTRDVPVILPQGLRRRTVVDGTVVENDGVMRAAAFQVVATRAADVAALPCESDVSTRQATATTDARGTFTMYLDPGTYTFDFDPPQGAPSPRFTQTDNFVPASATVASHFATTFTLPAAFAVEGIVHDVGGAPLGLAAVRFFEIVCATTETCTGPLRVPPALRAEARSDAAGHFRAVFGLP